MKYFLLLLGLMGALAAGCSSTNSAQPGASVIMPLTVGNSWVYQVTIDSEGQTVTYMSYDTVIGTETVNGVTWTKVAGRGEYRNTSQGLYGLVIPDLGLHPAKYPTYQGDRFPIADSLRSDSIPQKFYIEVKSTSYPMTTAAGTFNTIHYHAHNIDSANMGGSLLHALFVVPDDAYYAPGIGLIKSVDTTFKETIELVSYDLK